MTSIPPPLSRQRGVSLVIVLVMMLLSTLLVLGSSRVAHLSEFMAGNDTDAQRALEAAQMLLRDAELDIQDVRDFAGLPSNVRTTPLGKGSSEKLQNLTGVALSAGAITCAEGVCLNQGVATSGDPANSFWNNPTSLSNYTSNNRGATYGQWTGANPGAVAATSNPILSANPARAWYWIELLPYTRLAAEWAQECAPNSNAPPYLFRITAVALGRLGAPTVVQEIFVARPEGEGRRCPL